MEKPKKQIIEYYDWFDSWDYIKEKYNLIEEFDDLDGIETDVWSYIIENFNISNGITFEISDYELKYNKGEFAKLRPKGWQVIVEKLMEEFGELLLMNPLRMKTATFMAEW